jgi:uncharacterized protein (TIRG00374 family)
VSALPLAPSPPGRLSETWALRARLAKPWLRFAVTVTALAAIFGWLLRPDIDKAAKSTYLFGKISIPLLVAGIALEVASLLADAQLTHLVLSPGSPGRSKVLRANLSTLAVGHVVPGGTGPSSVAAYKLFTRLGVPAGTTAFGLAVRGIGSAAVLNLIFWAVVGLSLPFGGFKPAYGVIAVGGVVVFASVIGAATAFSRRPTGRSGRLQALSRRLPARFGARLGSSLEFAAARLRALLSDWRMLATASAWAAANWLLDAASLWVFILAFGHEVPPVELLVAYGLANVLAAIPVTPSGLGVVEGALVPALVGFHVGAATAIFAVLAYRLVNFWLPVPTGVFSYLTLRSRRCAGDAPAKVPAKVPAPAQA